MDWSEKEASCVYSGDSQHEPNLDTIRSPCPSRKFCRIKEFLPSWSYRFEYASYMFLFKSILVENDWFHWKITDQIIRFVWFLNQWFVKMTSILMWTALMHYHNHVLFPLFGPKVFCLRLLNLDKSFIHGLRPIIKFCSKIFSFCLTLPEDYHDSWHPWYKSGLRLCCKTTCLHVIQH